MPSQRSTFGPGASKVLSIASILVGAALWKVGPAAPLPAIAAASVLGILAQVSYRHAAERGQRRRDDRAARLIEAISDQHPPRFALYLRSFQVTGKLPTGRKDTDTRLGTNPFMPGDPIDFETELAEALEKEMPLYGLGLPGEHIGAGRILTDDATWQAKAQALIRDAELVILIPSARSGTLWEIRHILDNGYETKTIFVMPDVSSTDDARLERSAKETIDGFREDRRKLLELGVVLPQYQGGTVFMLDAQGRMQAARSLTETGSLNAAFRNVRADLANQPRTDVCSLAPDDPAIVEGERCPGCDSASIRELTGHEKHLLRMMELPWNPTFERRRICAACGRHYRLPKPQVEAPKWYVGAFASLIVSGFCVTLLWIYIRSGELEELWRDPDLSLIVLFAFLFLVFGFGALWFPLWCIAGLVQLVARARRWWRHGRRGHRPGRPAC